jgi:pilus assembly protein CpaF
MPFELVIPFLRPIAHLLADPGVSEIMVNGARGVFVERDGRLVPVPGVHLDERNLRVAVRNIARALGGDISEEQPILDARLEDGSRVAAVFPPCSLGGTTLTIRRFQQRVFTAEELVRGGMMSDEMLTGIRDAVRQNHTILISGGTSTGKTTLLDAISAYLPADDRLVVIEDTAELHLAQRNVVRLEARREQRDLKPVTIRDLLRAALRHRPDRIIVGEVRGSEAYDLLEALNTGHAGSLSTIHANSAEQALNRFASCVAQSGVDLPYAVIRAQIAACVQLVIHLQRVDGRREVSQLLRVGTRHPSRAPGDPWRSRRRSATAERE